jgi:hypothetical protein
VGPDVNVISRRQNYTAYYARQSAVHDAQWKDMRVAIVGRQERPRPTAERGKRTGRSRCIVMQAMRRVMYCYVIGA